MTGLRESKKAATRQAIEDATLTVITHRGIEGLTVAAVAEEAGVSVRTFHNYFSSVNEALQFQCSNLLDSFASIIEHAPAECELQSPAAGWGSGYATGASIKRSRIVAKDSFIVVRNSSLAIP